MTKYQYSMTLYIRLTSAATTITTNSNHLNISKNYQITMSRLRGRVGIIATSVKIHCVERQGFGASLARAVRQALHCSRFVLSQSHNI
jgi:hypothetical protein